jgi:hypothetical protein
MGKSKIKIDLPQTTNSDKPFVFIFAEPDAIETLKSANKVFSEHSEGLTTSNAAENFESTGSGNEAADTTFS